MKTTAFMILFLCVGDLNAEHLRMYHIGNSLTWDSKPGDIATTLRNAGNTVEQGYHISCGASLTHIQSDPDDVCVPPPEPYGTWTNALSKYEWDAITIQAYKGGTGLTETIATQKIIEEAISNNRNGNCKFYLYLAWPDVRKTASFSERVLAPFTGDNESVFLSSGFLDYWHQKMVALFPDLDIRTIPTGIAYATIDQKLIEIPVGEYTNTYDIYRDAVHMNLKEGRHVAFTSMLCALSEISPDNQSYTPGYIESLDEDFIKLAHNVVWYTLSIDERTKISVDPEIGISYNSSGSVFECTFLGNLFHSGDLTGWNAVSNATSPYRIGILNEKAFYRSVMEE